MPLPITIPNTFANATATIPLSQLDNNFATVEVAVNSIGNGAFSLANAQITGGTISNVTLDNVSVDVETLSNVTITNLTVDGNATFTNAAVTANVATITTANTTDVTASNSAVISVNTSGNALRITQVGSGNALVVEDSANPDSTPFVIDAGGNIISGYTTTVSVSGGTRPLTVNGAGQILVRATNDTSGATLNFGKTRSTSLASNTIVQSGDELGAIYFAGDDGTDINTNGAAIRAEVDGTPGTNDMPGRLVFSTTADGASTPTERMRIDSSGNLLVGTTSNASNYRLNVVAQGSSNPAAIGAQTGANGSYALGVQNASGTNVGGVIANASTTSYATSSDYRLKENVQPMVGALAKVAALKPCTYTWKADGSLGEGFIAHELQAVVPNAVSGEKDGEEMQGVDYGKLTPILTAALQEAIAKIEALQARIAVLEAK